MKVSNKKLITCLIIFVCILLINIISNASTDAYIIDESLTYKDIENTTLISGFDVGSKISNVISKFNEDNTVKFFDNTDTEITDTEKAISTGNIIKIYNSSEELLKSYTTVIYGDVSGDGAVNAVDALWVVKYKLGLVNIENEANIEAGRITNDSRTASEIPSSVDALSIVKYKLNPEAYPIDQKLIVEGTPDKPDDNTYVTPAELHGKLSVSGTNIVDKNGEKFQLKGVSTHGISWFPQYVNQDAFTYMRDEWGLNVVRLAMYSNLSDGYTRDLWTTVQNGVDYATNAGLYVIIDWHVLNDQNPNTYKAEAIEFFKSMATKYKDNTNVLYEICNEPNGGVTWEGDIKPYAEEVIAEIRAIDNDAIIICGTPNWSQDVDIVSQSPITDQNNIVYALHFYAATHKENSRTKLTTALNNGLPIFVSEFGICEASGNGTIDVEEANTWISLLNKNNISYVCWNLSNKNEASSIISSSTNKVTGWTEEELSQTGIWLVKTFKSPKIHYKFATDTSGDRTITINVKDGNGIEEVESTLTDSTGIERAKVKCNSSNADNDMVLRNKKGDIIEIEYFIKKLIPDSYKITTVIKEKNGKLVTFDKEYNINI